MIFNFLFRGKKKCLIQVDKNQPDRQRMNQIKHQKRITNYYELNVNSLYGLILLFSINLLSMYLDANTMGLWWCGLQCLFCIVLFFVSNYNSIKITTIIGVIVQMLFIIDWYFYTNFVYLNYEIIETNLFFVMIFLCFITIYKRRLWIN